MSEHPKNLEETALWKIYIEKVSEQDSSRRIWVKKVYDNAVIYLKRVCETFPNYTLHDETHVLNVMYAMGAILGDQIGNLSVGEVELLILAASLHDIGMVYDDAEMENVFNDERKCKHFLKENSPELIGVPHTDWSENTRQWYLRSLHPFRIHEILRTDEWNALIDERPQKIVPVQNIVAVCQSHGEDISSIKNNPLLKYLPAKETEPLFCAMLLRLADLLDFDDTRAPQILFKYAADNEESVKEWRKHMVSTGFKYPQTPSRDELIFSAECKEPCVEYSIRDFLDWIDIELINCKKLQGLCYKDWQRGFSFPRSVSGDGIISDGYVSDKFMLTMDQNRILKLLTGENFYYSNDAFIRELLQNAIDATLLRGKLDSSFKVENARIDLWEWNDKDGNILFRIDDQGTGMTSGMFKNYFLKVGNSYYTSKELKRDLSSSGKDFYGISRFGIGFLSCFLCGTEAEVSTLYFDDNKSRDEYELGTGDRNGYGLRMQITGLSGYYTLRSQANNHIIKSSLPTPESVDSAASPKLEYNGYRSKAGTSIVIKLDPGKLGAIDLKNSVEKYIYGTHMPVFYNGQRLGYTYSEIMEGAHKLNGETVYELSDREKEEYDKTFPNAKGQYPKIVITAMPFDTNEYQVIPNLSGICVKYKLIFDSPPQWQVKDQTYTISADCCIVDKTRYFKLCAKNTGKYSSSYINANFELLLKRYGKKEVYTLKQALEKFMACPVSTEELGDAWLPFANGDISNIWTTILDKSQEATIHIEPNRFNVALEPLTNVQRYGISYFYQGVLTSNIFYDNHLSFDITFFLENELQPVVDIGRTITSGLPLEALMAIIGIVLYLDFDSPISSYFDIGHISLPECRRLRNIKLGKWILETQNKHIIQVQEFLQTPLNTLLMTPLSDECNLQFRAFSNDALKIMHKFISAYFQDTYDMKICYENGQCIVFTEKENTEYDDTFDKFPPMMFCKAGSDKSRRYLCCSNSEWRRGITLDHPFAQWLIENAIKIECHFPRQFQQIVYSLCDDNAQQIIKTVNEFREQITKLNVRYGIDLSSLPKLTEEDFWDHNLYV